MCMLPGFWVCQSGSKTEHLNYMKLLRHIKNLSHEELKQIIKQAGLSEEGFRRLL